MALLQNHLVFFIAAIIIVVRLLSYEVLKRYAFLGLRGWSFALSAVEVRQAIAAHSGPLPQDKQAAFLRELQPSKVREWRDPLMPWQLPGPTHAWFAEMGPAAVVQPPSPLAGQPKWWSVNELLSLMNLSALLAVSYVLVGGYECLEGLAVPSYHVTLLAACALASALVYLAQPLVKLGVAHLEVNLALCMGGCVAAVAALGFAVLCAATQEGARSIPWVDLGAPLGVGVARSVGQGGVIGVGVGVALFMFAIGTLFLVPALRTARFFALRVAAADARPEGARVAKIAARAAMYAPALVAALWFRPFITVTAHDAVPCTRLLSALAPGAPASPAPPLPWGAGVSRDCRASLPGAGSAGGETLAGLLPLWALAMLPGEGWAAYAAALGRVAWISESSWLRWRCAAVVVFAAGGLVWQWRGMLQSHLDGAWREAGRALHLAGLREAAGKPRARCTAAHPAGHACSRPAPECALEQFRWRALVTLAQAGMQLLAVPLVLTCLAVLATRGTGLGGLGACNTVRRLVEGAAVGLGRGMVGGGSSGGAGAGSPADSLSWILREGGDAVFGAAFSRALMNARADLATTALNPALWRPLLSYLLFCTLVTWWVLGELGLMYWRVMGLEQVEGEEEEGEKEGEGSSGGGSSSSSSSSSSSAPAPPEAASEVD